MGFTFDHVASGSKAGTLACIDLSRWDLDQLRRSAWCFQICRAKQILLPDNLAIMSAGFLNHATKVTGSSFTIPAGVKKIGYAHTIYDFATDNFVEFTVAEGNENYKAVDGILYSMDGTEMLAVPRNKPFENGVYEIPEGVTFLGELSFSRNYNIHTLVLPDSYVLRYVPVHDEEYIVFKDTGNLNAGSNLSIAIYCYTGITRYEVKDTNPRYSCRNGILYSKDGTEVTAVPARYAAAMDLPEGVERWSREAMWAEGSSTVDGLLKDCPGVSLPASLVYIEQEQLAMLNRLHENRAGTDHPFTITLDPANTAFYLDETGALCKTEPITITAQPQDWFGAYGEHPCISVTAEGEELQYQWYYRDKGKTSWSQSSECDDTYDSYPLDNQRAGRQVYCRITDRNGTSVKTAIAVMDFAPQPAGYTGPVITGQPRDWAGNYDEVPDISVTAEGEDLQYQWYYRDKGKTKWSLSSECDDSYDSYPLTKARDGRELYCVITDQYGLSVTSGIAVMARYIPEGYTGPVITGQPCGWAGEIGAYPAVSVKAEGENLRYQWYYRDAGKTAFLLSSDRDDVYDSYPLTVERAGRELYCVVTDEYGYSVTSDTVTMDFDAPPGWTGPTVDAQPENWTGAMYEYPAITFRVTGEGLTYQWYYRGAGEQTWHRSSETDNCYNSYPLTAARSGREVYCVVTDRYGFAVASEIATMREAEASGESQNQPENN